MKKYHLESEKGSFRVSAQVTELSRFGNIRSESKVFRKKGNSQPSDLGQNH